MNWKQQFERMIVECETFGSTLEKDFTDFIPYHKFRCTVRGD